MEKLHCSFCILKILVPGWFYCPVDVSYLQVQGVRAEAGDVSEHLSKSWETPATGKLLGSQWFCLIEH